jgi:arylsulfatase B
MRLAAAIGLLSVGGGCRPEPGPGRDAPPNVLLVVLDDAGADRLGVYGNALAHTPVLDGLAAEGRWFRRAWGYPVCGPARAALQTGNHAARTGVWRNPDDGRVGLPGSERTLAEVLRPAGYSTAYVGKWHLDPFAVGDPYEGGPLAHGYDAFEGTPGNLLDPYDWLEVVDGDLVPRTTYVTSVLADAAVERVTGTPEPWFVTFAPHPPHGPLHVPPAELHTYEALADDPVSLVNAMMEATDTELGRVLAALDEEVRARTVVLVVGDNGDRFEGNGAGGRGKTTLADEGVGVPLIVAGPAVGDPGPTDALASVVDVAPTLAWLAGEDAGPVDGRSLRSALRDAAAAGGPTIVAMEVVAGTDPPVARGAARSDTHKLVRDPHGELLFHYDPGVPGEGRPLTEVTDADRAAAELLRAALRDAGVE